MFEPDALLEPDAYPHPVTALERIETHMSWVFLTGAIAYKVKKPVDFGFADFSSLARREHFCRRELELNRAFAPQIYLDVVPLYRSDVGWRVGSADATDESRAAEWAVRMQQFPSSQRCDRLLAADALNAVDLFHFGKRLAVQHEALPAVSPGPIRTAVLDNFATLEGVAFDERIRREVARAETLARRELDVHSDRLNERAASAHAKRCHGDLHTENLVSLNGELQAFDCLEFNEALASIDVWADVAFLFMDLHLRGHAGLAYAFIDGYLDVAGDYEGAVLLPLYANYRAMVRAKVAGLRFHQAQAQASLSRVRRYLDWSLTHSQRSPGEVLLTHGLSGSGKSYWSQQLVEPLEAIRIRSDVFRKVRAGLKVDAHTDSPVGSGLYAPESSLAIYGELAALATDLAAQGERVIVDAASLKKAQRQAFYRVVAARGIDCRVIAFVAEEATLRERIRARCGKGNDPSEADIQVLEWQLEHADPLSSDEPVITFDTQRHNLAELMASVTQSG